MNKKSEKSPFWRLCGPLLLFWLIEYATSFIVELIAMIPHLGEVIDYSAITSGMTQDEFTKLTLDAAEKMYGIVMAYQVQITTIAALCTVPLTLALFLKDRKKERELGIPRNKKAESWRYVELLALGAALCIGLNALSIMSNLALASDTYQTVSNTFYSASFPVQVICLGILVPITEELMFRGVLFNRYRERGGFFRAAVCSSILFSLTHGNMVQFLYAMILGMFLAYAYEKFGSLKAPIFLHIAANMTSLIVTKADGFTWLAGDAMRLGIAAIVGAFVSSVMFVLIQWIDEKPEGMNGGQNGGGEPPITPDMFR